jgi:hypothetical protein
MKTPSFRSVGFAFVLITLLSNKVLAQDSLRTFHIGFLYPISNQGADSKYYSNSFSFHVLAGKSREERAFALAGLALKVQEDATGFKTSGLANIIGGRADGFTLAGLTNIIGENTTGFTVSGLYNQYHGGTGTQIAGLMNLAKHDVDGFQAAGVMNKANNVNGVQVAGLVNQANEVHGAQVGFINIANSSKYPVGIINLIKDGERSLGISVDDNLSTLLTFRSGSKKMYGIIGVGNNFNNEDEVLAIHWGLGAHFFSTERFRLNTEITTTMLESYGGHEGEGEFEKYSLSVLPALRFGRFELYAGPSLNVINTDSAEGYKMVDNYIWDHVSDSDKLTGIYIGYTGGINMKL